MTTQPIEHKDVGPEACAGNSISGRFGFVRQARPALDGAQPGHVRRGSRQRADHGAVGAGAASRPRRGTGRFHRRGVGSGCGSPCLFANFSEALAEGRGKAQAEALRRTRQETQAKKLHRLSMRNAQYELVPSTMLRKNDVFLVEAGDIVPADGEVDRRHRLGGRKRRHRRKRAGDPRIGRRSQRRDRRHAPSLRLAGGPRHCRTRARVSSTA